MFYLLERAAANFAKGLRRLKRGNSLRAIAAELAARGYVNVNEKEYSAA